MAKPPAYFRKLLGGKSKMKDLRKFSWRRKYSQRGEDGMIEEVFSSLGIDIGYFVELGGWDGKFYSNVFALAEKGWSGLYIEQDTQKYNQLQKNTLGFKGVKSRCSSVNLESGTTLDDHLNAVNAPHNFDILSLDIDGCDYWVWGSLSYRPKLVVIEYNSNWEEACTIPYDVNHMWDGTQYYGASALALKRLADHKGYDWIGHIPNNNLFFIDKRYNQERFQVLAVLLIQLNDCMGLELVCQLLRII